MKKLKSPSPSQAPTESLPDKTLAIRPAFPWPKFSFSSVLDEIQLCWNAIIAYVKLRRLPKTADDSQKIPIESIFSIWSSSQWWPGKPMDMLQIHWIFKSRGDTLTPPPSDFTTNPRNQAVSAIINVLSFKRFRWNSFVLKCDHRLCESPATPQNSRWLPKNSDRVDFPHMIQFTVVTRISYGFASNPLNFRESRKHSHAPTKRFHNKPSQPGRLFHNQCSHFQAFWMKFSDGSEI